MFIYIKFLQTFPTKRSWLILDEYFTNEIIYRGLSMLRIKGKTVDFINCLHTHLSGHYDSLASKQYPVGRIHKLERRR